MDSWETDGEETSRQTGGQWPISSKDGHISVSLILRAPCDADAPH
jgi:hypothetical protein